MLVNLARLVFSQSSSVLRSVVRRRLSIMVLILSLSSATSPRAFTWIDRVRSPLVTAVATSAMARTWVVRLAARRFTLPVKSFQVPEAPGKYGLLVGEGCQCLGHVIYGFGLGRDLALRFHGEVLFQLTIGHHRHDQD